ncbi:MAG: YafY family protein [Actinomycetota bacterium]
MSDPTARALTLLSLLQTHRHWSGAELADRLGVSARTVRRDVDRLRELGYPVEAMPGVDGGYQLAAGAHLPPLVVDDDEAVALAIGLRAAAGASIEDIGDTTLRVMAKLEQILPDHVRRRIDAVNANVESLRWAPTTVVPPASLGLLAQACRDREEVRFEYTRNDGEISSRLVQPLQLVSVGQRWYLVAWDVRREDWRTFRIDRMEEPRLGGVRFEPKELPSDSPAEYVAAGLRQAFAVHEATIDLTGPEDGFAAMRHWYGAEVTEVAEGRRRLWLRSESLDWLAGMVAIFATLFDVTIVGAPAEAVAMLRHGARRLDVAVTDDRAEP